MRSTEATPAHERAGLLLSSKAGVAFPPKARRPRGRLMRAPFRRTAAVGRQRRAVMPRPTTVQKATTTTMPLMKTTSTDQSTLSRRFP